MREPARPLRILHLEDDPADRSLVLETLRADGLSPEVLGVDSRDGFEAALRDVVFDLILADYRLPTFDGLSAQRLAAECAPATPFIFVSGTLGEEIAIDRLKSGATDYVLKQRLARLPGAVRRALAEADQRRERLRAEEELRRLNSELDERVERRTRELAETVRRLARSERDLRASEARLQAVLDHSPAAIAVKDLDGRYGLVNREFTVVTRLSAEQVLGHTDHDVFTPRLAAIYRGNDTKVIETGMPAQVEEPFMQDGALRIYSSTKFPLRDDRGSVSSVCMITLDITEKRHAEETVKIAAREAEKANAAKSEFLSRMSHDFRTPLNAILGFAQLLESDRLSEEQAESVRHILSGGRHLLGMIDEVLDITRIESGQLSLSPEPVAAGEVILSACELVRPLADRRDIAIRTENVAAAGFVRADRQRLIQILLNLLSNALKYNRPGGSVTVSAAPIVADRLRITVTDTGFGIPREKVGLLFRRFERLGAEATDIEGTGLGLAVSQGLAEAMGGSMGVQTTVGVGSSFWVELTMCDAPAAAASPVAGDSRAALTTKTAVSGTVLYIEDNSANVKLLERVLQRRPGVTLLVAGNGSLGLSLASAHQPDLILLDLHLPDLNGDEIMRRLHQNRSTERIPIVVLSADATIAQERRLRQAGASGYLTKPFHVADVLATIDHHLSSSYARR